MDCTSRSLPLTLEQQQQQEQEEEEEEEEQGGKGFSDKPYLAGGPEDCLKHVVLVSLLRHFVEDCRPFTFIDAHAGGGLYNLECDESQVFRNHEGGIAQVIDGVRDKTISDTVYRLMYAAMARLNIALGSHGFQHYLGSTAWALQWLRCQDQDSAAKRVHRTVGLSHDVKKKGEVCQPLGEEGQEHSCIFMEAAAAKDAMLAKCG
ncbi:Ribosomal RNA large subunit methyltransferase J [Symbiodinium microadriaticum]|uniref:Ribosomal RNA large subunit methyltransferase J n=1 Tax=Symbiodinium microadriaticum TaxID=2951 RepID=A0A1Q9BTB2_SYMMI|nr:Ribosomal RNA large subunit methyltransferase J [Symbiodinium microadriaticum]